MPPALPQEKFYTEDYYYNLPEDVRAELVDGVLIYNQAAPSRIHQTILSELHAAIHSYFRTKGGFCRVYPAPFAVKLFENRTTIVEPDISVICDRDKLTDKGCTGAPDWVIEIVSPGNPGHDYILKLNLYAEAGVCEYWIVNPIEQTVLVYHLEEKVRVIAYTFQDKVKVNIYEDLYIDFADISGVLDV